MIWAIVILLALVAALAAGGYAMARTAANEARRVEAASPAIGRIKDLSGGGRLHYLEAGAARDGASPIVLVHGIGGTLRHFSSTILDRLAEERRVIAVDRPDCGYSEAPPGYAGGLEAQARVLVDGLAEIGVERAIWVGHSLGGAVALRAALDRPQAVAGLALIAPAAYPFTPRPPFPKEVVGNDVLRRLLAWTLAPAQMKKVGAATVASVFAPDPPPPDFALAAGGALSIRPRQVLATLREQAMLTPSLTAQSTRYGELAQPVHVLFGAEDALLVPQEHADRLAAAAPRVETRLLDGRGHMLPFSAPNETVETILAAARAAEI